MVSNETYAFITGADEVDDGIIYSVSLTVTPPDPPAITTFLSGTFIGLTVVCIDQTYLYWVNSNYDIYRAPWSSPPGSVAPIVSTGITNPPSGYKLVCAVDASYIYWNPPNAPSAQGYVARANLDGTNPNLQFKIVSTSNTYANVLASTITRTGFIAWGANAQTSSAVVDIYYYSEEYSVIPPDNINTIVIQATTNVTGINALAVNNDSMYWGYKGTNGPLDNNISKAVYFENGGFSSFITPIPDFITNPLPSTSGNANEITGLGFAIIDAPAPAPTPAPTPAPAPAPAPTPAPAPAPTPAPVLDSIIVLGFNPSSPVTYEENKMIQLTITNASSYPLSSYTVSTDNSTLTRIFTLAGPTDEVLGYNIELKPGQTVNTPIQVVITVTHTTGNYNTITLVVNPPPTAPGGDFSFPPG